MPLFEVCVNENTACVFFLKVQSYLFICFWLCWVFVAVWAFLQLWRAAGDSSCDRRASHCRGFLVAARAVGRVGFSGCGSWTLERRLDICGAWSRLLHSMWYLLGSGIESLSATLAGGFFTTEPPGKPAMSSLCWFLSLKIVYVRISYILCIAVHSWCCEPLHHVKKLQFAYYQWTFELLPVFSCDNMVLLWSFLYVLFCIC